MVCMINKIMMSHGLHCLNIVLLVLGLVFDALYGTIMSDKVAATDAADAVGRDHLSTTWYIKYFGKQWRQLETMPVRAEPVQM